MTLGAWGGQQLHCQMLLLRKAQQRGAERCFAYDVFVCVRVVFCELPMRRLCAPSPAWSVAHHVRLPQ